MNTSIERSKRPLAVVTGASTGIGYELAKVFAKNGYDLIVNAEDAGIIEAANAFRISGNEVIPVQADLTQYEGVETLWAAIQEHEANLECVAMNAGVGVTGEFTDIPLEREMEVVNLNIVSLIHLTKRLLPLMLKKGEGKILYTSSIAAESPGPYYAVYAASKAFVQSFAQAIRYEVKDKGITITSLQPGATDTEFFERADAMTSKAGQAKKDDPADVAKDGFDALMAGHDHVIAGSFMNKVQAKVSNFVPEQVGAKLQGEQLKPGGAFEDKK